MICIERKNRIFVSLLLSVILLLCWQLPGHAAVRDESAAGTGEDTAKTDEGMARIREDTAKTDEEMVRTGEAAGEASQISGHPNILFISSYAYDWDSVPYQLRGVASVLGTKTKMDYVFMNTKKYSYDDVKQGVYDEIARNIASDGQYAAVVLEDDAALDFALEYRNDLFEQVPMVFMGINTAEKANKAHEDPLITGMIEYFPYGDTIALARKINPKATKIVGITDSTESGKGCTQRFYDEEANFPELQFGDINTSELTQEQIKTELKQLDNSTILVFLALVDDGDGNVYSLPEALDFVGENTSIPVYKADMLGIGEGIFGGYVSSYEEMGIAAANQVTEILSGTSPADIPVDTMGGYPEFDQNMLDKFHISSNLIPKDAVIVNYVPTFYEQYKKAIWITAFLVTILVMAAIARLAAARQKTNRKLEEALKQAEKANVAKSQFLAQMSHEIRTPMNAIIGLTTLSRSHLDDREKMVDYLNKIDGSSKLLLGIINDVLDMSAIESGKLKLDNEQYDFKRAISTVTGIFYQQALQKNIDFNVHMKGVTEEQIVGDELRVNQILMNLLSNAVKFTSSGGKIDLYIIQASMSGNKVQLRFVITDTGCGMSEDMLKRLFKPFEQESAGTARKHGGSGLGMSIAKRLIEKMNGSIQVESKVQEGTTFTVDIPFGACEQKTAPVQSVFKDITVLVVDDDKDACSYCCELLDRLQVAHDEAYSGEQALEMIGEAEDCGRSYQMCLIDWKMPGMNGLELTKKIRQIFGNDEVIIILSAYDLNEIENKGIKAGANYFVLKPLFQSTIYNALMRITSGADTAYVNNSKETYDFTGKKVLIAEDVALNLEVAVNLMKMVGLDVVCAEDGKQAVDTFVNSPAGTFDCILMDINMPVMDGYEATKAIRSSQKEDAKLIPIYAMTANAFSSDVTEALNAGMDGHIAKPIETDVLYKTLEAAFQ